MSSPLSAIQDKLSASPPVANTRLAILVNWIKDRLDDAVDRVTVDALIVQVHLLYDSYIAPVDIPFVPDVAEPAFDKLAKEMLAVLIRGFHSLIHQE